MLQSFCQLKGSFPKEVFENVCFFQCREMFFFSSNVSLNLMGQTSVVSVDSILSSHLWDLLC